MKHGDSLQRNKLQLLFKLSANTLNYFNSPKLFLKLMNIERFSSKKNEVVFVFVIVLMRLLM